MEPNRTGQHLPRNEPFACCGNCVYFWADESLGGVDDLGECRRFPPSVIECEDTPEETWNGPLVAPLRWCGEWRKRTAERPRSRDPAGAAGVVPVVAFLLHCAPCRI